MIRRHVAASIVTAVSVTVLAFGAGAAGQRSYSTGQTVLELGGRIVGAPYGVSGGGVVAEVATSAGTDKRTVNPRPEELELQVSNTMNASFWSLIAQALNRNSKLSGAVTYADGACKETQKLVFSDGIVTELGIPGLDAAAKDFGYFTLRILPERASRTFGSGAPAPRFAAPPTKRWSLNAFRVNLPGVNPTGVVKVEPFAIRAGALQTRTFGEVAVPAVTPGKRTITDLVLTVRESDAKGVIEWYNGMVQGQPAERNGSIELLAAQTGEVLAAFNLTGVGIYRLDVERTDSGLAERRFQAFAYVETARFRPVALGK